MHRSMLALLVLSACGTAPAVDGAPGAAGTDGLACWDLNGDGIAGGNEDTNGDGTWDAADCQGEDGLDGADGAAGEDGQDGTNGAAGADGSSGLACWDLDGDGLMDAGEDANGDGAWDAADCHGDDAEVLEGGDDGGLSGDAGARGEHRPEHLYTVEFRAGDLWDDAESPDDVICLDLWEPYLASA